MEIKELKKAGEISVAIELANSSFRKFVAPYYDRRGRNTFEDFVKTKTYTYIQDVNKKSKRVFGCFIEGDMAAMAALKGTSHLCLLFVDEWYMGQGIGTMMVSYMRDSIVPMSEDITVNASPYAVKFYRRLGFKGCGSRIDNEGVICYPMKLEKGRHISYR